MKEKLKGAFDTIHADENMKNAAYAALERQRSKKKHGRKSVPAFALSFALLLFCTTGYALYATPVSYIGIDVNPSLELTLNRFDRVICVRALNADADAVVQSVSLQNRTYTDAIDELMASDVFSGYLVKDAALTFTVVSDKEDELIRGINACSGGQMGYCQGMSASVRQAAMDAGVSTGKYRMYEQIVQYDPDFSIDSCNTMSMRELRMYLRNCGGTPSMGEGHGGGKR